MSDITMRRTAIGLEADNDMAIAELAKIKVGADVLVKVSKPRSLAQHRLFWSVLTHVSDATAYDGPEQLLVALKVALGRFDLMKLPNGKVVPVPQSVAFASMPGDEFRRFFDDAMNLICRDVLPGVSVDEILRDAGLTAAVADMRDTVPAPKASKPKATMPEPTSAPVATPAPAAQDHRDQITAEGFLAEIAACKNFDDVIFWTKQAIPRAVVGRWREEKPELFAMIDAAIVARKPKGE